MLQQRRRESGFISRARNDEEEEGVAFRGPHRPWFRFLKSGKCSRESSNYSYSCHARCVAAKLDKLEKQNAELRAKVAAAESEE